MKYYYQVEGLLRNNIGDVLQGMVAKRFLPVDNPGVADREALSDISGEHDVFLLANGWYMHSFEKFPPASNVTPFYLSVHIANSELLLSDIVRKHFKKHAPIGCRDVKTLKLLRAWGIPAYYSSCLTITCLNRGGVEGNNDSVLLVDNVDHPVPENVIKKLESLTGKNIQKVSHDPPDISGKIDEYAHNSELHMEALLKRYCQADLVITTKIHCALPCLGMGLSVLFIHPNPADPRLATLREFLPIFSYEDILGFSALPVNMVNGKKLNIRKEFLENLVNDAVKAKSTPITWLSKYWKIKFLSSSMALMTRMGVVLMLKLGLASPNMRRVMGYRNN